MYKHPFSIIFAIKTSVIDEIWKTPLSTKFAIEHSAIENVSIENSAKD